MAVQVEKAENFTSRILALISEGRRGRAASIEATIKSWPDSSRKEISL